LQYNSANTSFPQNADEFATQVAAEYSTRREFNSDLFRGISIQFDESNASTDWAAQLAEIRAVKAVWPVKEHEPPKLVDSMPIPNQTEVSLHKRQNNETSIGNAPHVLVQVDKLHVMGFTVQGIQIAVLDDGVSDLA
jgi:hypothetical protein